MTDMLGSQFEDALAFAARVHRTQQRKGGDIPYISHLMAVSALALEHGADEAVAIAALLHDSLEDQPDQVSVNDLEERFGARVARIVQETGEPDKSLSWRVRNENYIEHLAHASDEAVLVSLCDKVHNMQSMAHDHAEHGDEFWSRFNAGRDEQAWKYGALLAAFKQRNAEPSLVQMLEEAMQKVGFE